MTVKSEVCALAENGIAILPPEACWLYCLNCRKMNIKPLTTEQGAGGRDLLLAGRFGVRTPVGHTIYSSPHSSRPALGPSQPPVEWVLGLLSGGKGAGAWRCPPRHSALLRLMSTGKPLWHPCACMTWYGETFTDTFTIEELNRGLRVSAFLMTERE